MPNFKDITGLRFGRLVTPLQPDRRRNMHWRCSCDCGNEAVVTGSNLRRGATSSCGCLQTESERAALQARLKHGQSYSATYRVWQKMKARCNNPRDQNYRYYGAIGIGCEPWNKYPTFVNDMGARPPGHDLHRLDNAKGYGPDNCVWLPRPEHMRLHGQQRTKVAACPPLVEPSTS